MKPTDTLRFKLGTRSTMKHYMHFLFWHHNYTERKLLETFPEYFEPIPFYKRMRRWWEQLD